MSLKEKLGEELYGQVLAKLGEDTKIAIVSDGSYIPKGKFDAKLEEINGYKEEIKQRDEQIGQLKESAKGNEELTKQLTELEKENKAWEGKMVATKKDFQVRLKAASLNPHDVNDILRNVDLDSLKLDDSGENIEGLDEILNKLKEEKPHYFQKEEEPKIGGRTPKDLGTPPPTGITKEQFQKMSYQERTDLYNSDRELYNQLNK